MRLIILLTLFITTLAEAQTMTRQRLEILLREKGVDLLEIEIRGLRLLMGEVSGHLQAVPFSKVQILVTDKEAIFKNEVDSVSFQGGETLGNVVSIRFNGQYVLKEDVKASIVLR